MKKIAIICDGHAGAWAQHDTSRHDMSCRAEWNLSLSLNWAATNVFSVMFVAKNVIRSHSTGAMNVLGSGRGGSR